MANQGSRGTSWKGASRQGTARQSGLCLVRQVGSTQGMAVKAKPVMSRNGTASHGKLCQREAVVKSLGWLGWAAQVMAARGSQVPARSGEDGSV